MVCTATVNEKKTDLVFTVFAFQVMALVTICLHFPCMKVHSRFILKTTVGKISIFKLAN